MISFGVCVVIAVVEVVEHRVPLLAFLARPISYLQRVGGGSGWLWWRNTVNRYPGR